MPEPAQTLGDFALLHRIGSGGMAEVFLAEKRGAEGISKRVVVKRILPGQRRDARLHAMFVREARLAMGLDHPNIVQVHELVDHPRDGLLLAMEYVEGVDLARVLQASKLRGEPIPPYVAALIAREAAKGLHHAHEHADADGTPLEIVHRDVSPQNILVSRRGTVKIADLGIATARLYRDATTGVKGKYRYMAPEQVAGAPLDRRADVYALGVVLYEMLRLVSPYGQRTGVALLRAVRAGIFEPPLDAITDIPADLLSIVRRALAHDRAARYPTARELADDLSRALVAQGRVIDEAAIEALVCQVRGAPSEPALPERTPPDREKTAAATTAPAAPRMLLVAGATVGRYVVGEHIGHGGMGDVYVARDTTLDREVALKILRSTTSQEARRLLLREAKLAARFEHPGSVVIYDVGEAGGVVFIAMELVRGAPLSDFIGDPEVPMSRRVRWLVGAARVLAAAHASGLVHLDVKPGNLMVREGGNVKVLDFGIARAYAAPADAAGEPTTGDASFVGTLRYAAPERFTGEAVDGRADQFSWGITAWELLAGRHPHDAGDALGAAQGAGVEEVGPLGAAAPDVPEDVARVVDRALAKDPADRFADMDEVADALEDFAEPAAPRLSRSSIHDGGAELDETSRPSVALSLPSETHAPRRRAFRPATFGAAALGAAALGAAAFGVLARAPEPTPAPSSLAAPAAPVIDALGCSDAIVVGEGGADLAHAIGMAACARLSPEIGVDWAVPDAIHRLEVRAELHPGRAVITLRVAGREAIGAGSAPVPAISSAVAALAPQLHTAPWTPERVRLWGARDEAAARRIWRVWRRSANNLSPGIASEITQLLETDGDSPMPHLLALFTTAGGREQIEAAPARVLERLDRVPAARAAALRALLLAFPAERDRKEIVRLFRESYAAAPDDHTMTAYYAGFAVRMALPEAHALIERLRREAPTYCLGSITNAITHAAYRDDVRNEKYVAWVREILPEAAGRKAPVQHMVSMGRFADAREAIELTRRLGLESAGDPVLHAASLAQIEIAALAPAAAREHTALLLADPRAIAAELGGLTLSASYLEEGRIAEAMTAMGRSAEHTGAEVLSVAALRLARWLDLPPDPAQIARLERVVARPQDLTPLQWLEARSELGLARRDKAAIEEALGALDEAATREGDGEPLVRDRALVLGVALTRALHGDRAAAALWGRLAHAPDAARLSASLDAALALEATGDTKGAEAAYMLSAGPGVNIAYTGQRMLAIARLAALYRRTGRASEAAEREAILDQLWSRADPGLREAVKRLR